MLYKHSALKTLYLLVLILYIYIYYFSINHKIMNCNILVERNRNDYIAFYTDGLHVNDCPNAFETKLTLIGLETHNCNVFIASSYHIKFNKSKVSNRKRYLSIILYKLSKFSFSHIIHLLNSEKKMIHMYSFLSCLFSVVKQQSHLFIKLI